ncbi:unnamed protein product [Pleuronectes platessa]|uniref:Uncharacterized protein n=1 Tax=Pleuronectes platessa TaxID=8262 RepID=A0A9N7UY08_PLEPL|nr:unnamed protein product [Pleuronectes platessa]
MEQDEAELLMSRVPSGHGGNGGGEGEARAGGGRGGTSSFKGLCPGGPSSHKPVKTAPNPPEVDGHEEGDSCEAGSAETSRASSNRKTGAHPQPLFTQRSLSTHRTCPVQPPAPPRESRVGSSVAPHQSSPVAVRAKCTEEAGGTARQSQLAPGTGTHEQ